MKRNKFSLSYHRLFTCDMGELVPIGLTEVLPGDSFQHSTSLLIRVSPLLAPVMHPVICRVHHWYVPTRLVWDGFEDFITGGPDGDDATVPPLMPYGSGGAYVWSEGSLADYLGVPAASDAVNVSAIPFRAYNLIWNEWYRDQDLQTAVATPTTSGVGSSTPDVLLRCAWEKDYFTSARPWPQKGPEVTVPIGDEAPVIGDGTAPTFERLSSGPDRTLLITGGGSNVATFSGAGDAGAAESMRFVPDDPTKTGLVADLAAATPISINDLREAFALQRFAEARARYGSRYTEYLRYLGVRSSDARLQRPEYLGGGRQVLQFSEVLQTGVTTSGNEAGPGNLKGHGIGAMRSNRYRRFFEEHGVVISLLSVRPKTMYQNGLPRMWSRLTRDMYYQKELEHIGQQEVLQKEIYMAGGTGTPEDVFGYQDRYDEYRRMESGIAGEFRSTLNFWHLARIFTDAVTLNDDFVECTPSKRINAVTNKDQLWVMANHSLQARRLLSRTGSSFIF